jgi:glycosyltransferase involved in cell wall biosynthesis
LLESYNHVHLVLVGPNDIDTKKISKETKQLIKSTANIHAVGVQKDIRPYLLNANALVLPSYREGFGMVLIEAGAMSVPAIASDIIGCNEIIISGKNGELISAKNPDALLETMKKWVESPEYVNQLSLNAREMVMERYSQEIVWRNMLATYQNLSASIKHK